MKLIVKGLIFGAVLGIAGTHVRTAPVRFVLLDLVLLLLAMW